MQITWFLLSILGFCILEANIPCAEQWFTNIQVQISWHMSKMPRRYIFAPLRVKMQKDPPKIKDFVIFELRALKNIFFVMVHNPKIMKSLIFGGSFCIFTPIMTKCMFLAITIVFPLSVFILLDDSPFMELSVKCLEFFIFDWNLILHFGREGILKY